MDETDATGNVATWTREDFLAEVVGWVRAAARAAGLALTGEREQPHVRPWSSAVRFGAEGRDLWFKVNGPGTRHEGALVAALARVEPTLVPAVVAVDADRGWSLTRDAGPVMRATAPPDELWDAWEAVLLRYAEAQIRLGGAAEQVLATGLPVLTPATLPARLRELVDELAGLPPQEGGLTTAEQEKLTAASVEYDSWCAELAASGIPASVQHDDLHSGNICWGGSAGAARIIDWGDASWGFPLGTMLCTMNSLAWHAGREIDDLRVLRARDAYLEPFTRYADRADLVRYVDLARRVGCITRALSYRAALMDEPAASQREYEFPIRGWVLELLEI